MADALVPLIGSSEAGPLGAVHLPRLWLKVTLATAGRLPDDYDECGAGFDQMVLDGLGVDRDAALAFLRSSKPSYLEFEQWVVDQNGGSISAATIEASNAAILGYNHADDTIAGICDATGLANDGGVTDAASLNALEDWQELHSSLNG
jgi:hypothetical protein